MGALGKIGQPTTPNKKRPGTCVAFLKATVQRTHKNSRKVTAMKSVVSRFVHCKFAILPKNRFLHSSWF